MKTRFLQNIILISLNIIPLIRGSEHKFLQQEALFARKACLASKAVALGSFIAHPLLSNASLKKTARIASVLGVMGLIGSYCRLSGLLPRHARSLRSVSRYLMDGAWPTIPQGDSSQNCTCDGTNHYISAIDFTVALLGNMFSGLFCRTTQGLCLQNDGVYLNGERIHNSDCPFSGDISVPLDNTIEERELKCAGSIHTLMANTVVPVEVRQGSCDLVTLKAPRFLMDKLNEKYEYGVLNLTTHANCMVIGNVEMRYVIQTTNPKLLRRVRHEGIGALTLPGIGSHEVDTNIETSGSGNVKFQGNVRGRNIAIKQTSLGNLNIDGSLKALAGGCFLYVSGSGKMTGRNITGKADLRITLSSIGSITVDDVASADSTLSLFVSGSGNFIAQKCSSKGQAVIRQESIGGLQLKSLRAQSLRFTQLGSGKLQAQSLYGEDSITFTKTSIGTATVTNELTCRHFVIKQSGSGDTSCSGLDVVNLEIDNSSIGSVTLSGSCDSGSVTISGSGNCNLRQLQTSHPLQVSCTSIGRVVR
jgi:hypothetical protein